MGQASTVLSPVEDQPDAIPESVEEDTIADESRAKPVEADADGWISTKSLLESLAAQNIPVEKRTLQSWADKHQGTKPGFYPAYRARKNNRQWIWSLVNE